MENRQYISTDAAAARLGVKPNTLRSGLCRDGHYLCIRPVKLPNRLLVWPSDQIDALLAGRVSSSEMEASQ